MVLQTKGSLFENRSHDVLPWSVPDAFRKHILKKYYGGKGPLIFRSCCAAATLGTHKIPRFFISSIPFFLKDLNDFSPHTFANFINLRKTSPSFQYRKLKQSL